MKLARGHRCVTLALLFLPPSTMAAADQNAAPIELACLIQPRTTVTVSSAIEGVVEEVLVERGDQITKGQVLARLQADVERAAVEIARARVRNQAAEKAAGVRLDFASRALERSHNLQNQNVVSDKEMDEARSEKKLADTAVLEAKEARGLARLELQRAQAVLDLRTIRSPIDGVVVERILSPGEFADPPQLLELAEIDPLSVEVFAPIEHLRRIRVGMRANVIPEAPVGGSYDASVTVVDLVVDAASGTFGVRLELPNPELLLAAGLNCRVQFLEEQPVAAK